MNQGLLGFPMAPLAVVPKYVTGRLSADVTLTTVNVYVDGPSVTLTSGTWLLVGSVALFDSASAANMTAKLWDGVTVEASAETQINVANASEQLHLDAIVRVNDSATYKISVADGTNSTTGRIKAAAPQNGAGNNASYLIGLKLWGF